MLRFQLTGIIGKDAKVNPYLHLTIDNFEFIGKKSDAAPAVDQEGADATDLTEDQPF